VFEQKSAIETATSAEAIFSVSPTILSKFEQVRVPKYLIQHGLGKEFVMRAKLKLKQAEFQLRPDSHTTVGYVGNLLIKYIDRDLIIGIIRSCPDTKFLMIGPYESGQSSLGGGSADDIRFIYALKSMPNVTLTGPKSGEDLLDLMDTCDAFIICYSDRLPGYDLSNTHKMFEYLSTGKAVISTPILAHHANRELITMPGGEDESNYLIFFTSAIKRLYELNEPGLQRRRIELAIDNSYDRQIEKIESCLFSNK
jgi:glycosyltransferase involved in cell wall biosynthesis